MTDTTPALRHTVGYQGLGGGTYEVTVDGQPTLGVVVPVGTGWVAVSSHGTVLGTRPSRTTAALEVVKDWETQSRCRRL